MQMIIALTALVAAASAASVATSPTTATAPPQGWRPSGRLLLLPARLEKQPTTDNNDAKSQQESQSDDSQSARLLDSGEYYVLLPDGRLQMVKYTTAALVEEASSTSPSQQQQQQQQAYSYPSPAAGSDSFQQQQFLYPFPAESSTFNRKSQQVKQPEPALYQVQYVQFPLAGSQYAQTKLEIKEEEKPEKKVADQKQAEEEGESGFEANVQYRDVKPISAPIYTYNPAPLVRVLRK